MSDPRINKMLAALEECSDALDKFSDVDDGEDGPVANWAMRLKAEVDDALAEWRR